jgi:Flp pilus assembly protein TadD
MSILLDALKRAEQEKQAKQGTSAPEAPPARPAPAPVVPRLELEGMPEAIVAEKPVLQADRDAARSVFTAKQAAPAAGNRKKWLAMAGLLFLVASAGGYFWWEWNRLNAPAVAAPWPPRVAAPPAPQAATGTVATAKPADTAAVASAGGLPPVGAPNAAGIAGDARKARPQQQAAEAAVMSLLRESGGAATAAPLKMSRSLDPPRVHPDIAQGYDALKRGDFAVAKRSYEAAQAAEPFNVDAQLGLGTVAARTGDRAGALRHFRSALEIDPRNPGAMAGLAAMADKSAPEQLEAQLRADLSRYPSSSALHMALGNLYASQNRWTEAQQSFFEAFRLDPENADAAYNLAVSLDHLGQARVARDYYQRSLAAGQKQAVQFDRNLVKRRVEELRP